MRRTGLGLGALLVCVVAARAMSASPADAQIPAPAQQNPVRWALELSSPGPHLPGKSVDAVLVATIKSGWHLYAMQEPEGGPQPTSISVVAGTPFTLIGEIAAGTPTRAFDPNFNLDTDWYKDTARFLVPVKIDSGTATGRHALKVATTWVTCSDTICYPPADAVVSLDVWVGSTPPPAANEAAGAASATAAVSTSEAANAAATAAAGASVVPDFAASTAASTIGAYMGLAAVMGALSLLTPCVFPMVPITVSYFTNRARRSRKDAVIQAGTYGLGIILTFTAVGFTLAIAYGAAGLNRFAADPWLNLGITVMFVAFALSLFGVWELALPAKLLTAASRADSGRGQLMGAVLMGLAFTLTSFTCTAPFLGTLLVVAAQGDWQWPLAGMIAFSTVFALPFVILAFVPQVIASLPRSGPWLVAVKAVMGIVELAAAMKFLSNVDLVWGWNVFTRPVVLASWVALSAILVAYLAGFLRIGPAMRLGRPRAGRWLATAAAALLGIWLASGLTGRRLGELEAFLPPADLSARTIHGELPWIVNDYQQALKEAREKNQYILIDFTGYTCTNCRWMEANMFPRHDVSLELARFTRVRLYTDRRGEPYAGFQAMEQSLFGTVALPYYAIMQPDGRPVLGFGGLTRDAGHFIAFLRKGQED